MSQQQLVAYKRAYYERGLEIDKLNDTIKALEAKIEELESKVKEQEEPAVEVPVEAKKAPAKKGAK